MCFFGVFSFMNIKSVLSLGRIRMLEFLIVLVYSFDELIDVTSNMR